MAKKTGNQLLVENLLPKIFSPKPTTRQAAFNVIRECLEPSFRFNVLSALSVLRRNYDEKGRQCTNFEDAKRVIQIMRMMAVNTVYPQFFSKADAVEILLDIFSQHGVYRFEKIVDNMFRAFSYTMAEAKNQKAREGEYFFKLADYKLIVGSEDTLRMLLPDENETVLSDGKALCLKALVGTFTWNYAPEASKEMVWHLVCTTFASRRVEPIHVMLANKLIVIGSVAKARELVNLFIALVSILDNARNAGDVRLCVALCNLVVTFASDPTFAIFLKCCSADLSRVTLSSGDDGLRVDEGEEIKLYKSYMLERERLPSILEKCDFTSNIELAIRVLDAKSALKLIELPG